MINLIKYARGLRQGLYSAQILDDQPETLERERTELARSSIEAVLQERAQEFFQSLLTWLYKRGKNRTFADRAETRRVLVIDVNLPELPDVQSLSTMHGIDLESGSDTKTLDGRKAGLVLVDAILRNSPKFRRLPIVILSAYGMNGSEARLERIRKKPGAPVHYIKKSIATDGAAEEFKDVVGELLHDERLVFVEKLANFWELDGDQVCGMLGVRKRNLELIAQLFDRGQIYPNDDANQRVRLLKTMHESLYSLMRDGDAIRGWLNSKNRELDRERPIDLIASSDFERLAVVKHYVDFLCMR